MALLFLAGCHSFTTVHIVNTSITMVKNEEAIDLFFWIELDNYISNQEVIIELQFDDEQVSRALNGETFEIIKIN